MSRDIIDFLSRPHPESDAKFAVVTKLSEELRHILGEPEPGDSEGPILNARETFLARKFTDKLVSLGPKGSNTLQEKEYKTAMEGLKRIIKSIGETPIEPTRATCLRAAASGHLLPAANRATATALVVTKEKERFARDVEEWLDGLGRALASSMLGEINWTVTKQPEEHAAESTDDGQITLPGEPRG